MANFQLSKGGNIYKYGLIKRIGGGHFGEVWLADDNAIAQPLAIKIVDASTTSIDQELIEARIGNRMKHDNLVHVHSADVVQIGGQDAVIIAMEYLPSGSIASKTCSGNFVDIRSSVKAIIDILRGLEYLHDKGFYHNDIKPNNVLIGHGGEALLTDYGISEVTKNGQAIKPKCQYLPHKAPETFEDDLIDAKSDIYQVGMTLFRLVNGITLIGDAFNKSTDAEYEELVTTGKLLDEAGWQPFVPPALVRVIKKATHHNQEDRYSSALEMRRALEKLRFPGMWICSPTGDFEGVCGNYRYRFEITNGNKSGFTAFKMNNKSGRETRISALSASNLTAGGLEKARCKFMKAVVEGKV